MNHQPRVTVVGSGMIVEVQLSPTLYQLQRDGVIGDIHIAARRASQLTALRQSPTLARGFAGHSFTPHPDPAKVDPNKPNEDSYKQAFADAPRASIVMVAVPDQLHYEVT